MQIGAYILLFTTAGKHDSRLVNDVLTQHFCPVVSAHNADGSWVVCEDVMDVNENGIIEFRHYTRFLRHYGRPNLVVSMQEYAPLEHLSTLVERLVAFVRNSEGAVLFTNL